MTDSHAVGVLAFQGDFAEHIALLASMKVKAIEVRSVEDLKNCDRLIIPGGESTVMSRFLWMTGVGVEIQKRVKADTLPIYGTCAGAILLAKRVTGKNAPKSLALMDITIDRNAYGTQVDSFEASLRIKDMRQPLAVSFIRAPIITKVGRKTEILSLHEKTPVLVRQGRLLAGTFHPEMRGQAAVHRLFLAL